MASVGVGNIALPERLDRVRDALEKHDVFQWLYLGLICSFFLFDTNFHRLYFYLGILIPFLLFARWGDVLKSVKLPLWRFAAVYLLYLWMTLFWSADLSWANAANQTRLLFLTLFFLTMTLHLLTEDPGFADRILQYFGWAGAIGAAGAVAYHLAMVGDLGARMEGPGRAEHPIIGATLYGVAALCLLCSVIPKLSQMPLKLLGWAAFAVLILAMVLTQSRGPVLVMAGVIFLYLLATGRWKLALLLPLPAVVYGLLLLAGGIEPGKWITRGSTHRLDIWLQSWLLVLENTKSFLIGQGIVTDYVFDLASGTSVKSPHNLFLANQLYGGLIATVLFLGLICATAKSAFLGFRRSGNFAVCALFLFGLGVGLFDYRTVLINLSQEWMSFWLPFLLVAAGWPRAQSDRTPSAQTA